MSWNLQQINNATGQPTVPGEYVACPQATAAASSDLFVCAFGDQQHFAYVDGNSNIQDCWYDGATNQWNLQQINNATGQPTVPGEYVACPQATAAASSDLFVCAFGDQQHFAYGDPTNYSIDANNIQDCWYDGDTNDWNLQQINNATGQPTVPGEYVACPRNTASAGGGLFVCAFESQQHFTYMDVNSNIQDCWYDSDANQWNSQQINNATGQPTVQGGSIACPQAPSGFHPFLTTFGRQLHFTYFDYKYNIQDCWYHGGTGRWNLQQIGNGPATVPGEYLACPQARVAPGWGSFAVCTFGDQQHFAYGDLSYNIQDCWYDGATNQWNFQQINNGPPTVPGAYVTCPQAPAATGADVFVSTFGEQQHFTYLDGNYNMQDCWWG